MDDDTILKQKATLDNYRTEISELWSSYMRFEHAISRGGEGEGEDDDIILKSIRNFYEEIETKVEKIRVQSGRLADMSSAMNSSLRDQTGAIPQVNAEENAAQERISELTNTVDNAKLELRRRLEYAQLEKVILSYPPPTDTEKKIENTQGQYKTRLEESKRLESVKQKQLMLFQALQHLIDDPVDLLNPSSSSSFPSSEKPLSGIGEMEMD